MGIIKKIILLVIVAVFSAACSVIEYPETETVINTEKSESSSNQTQSQTPSPLSEGENSIMLFNIKKEAFTVKEQFEEIDRDRAYKALYGYEGSGYVQLDTGEELVFELEASESQHYRFGLCVCTQSAVISLSINDVEVGAYNIIEAFSFEEFSLDGIYMEKGVNTVKLKVLSGICYLDFYFVSDTYIPYDARYSVSRQSATKDADGTVLDLMNYLGETFGKKILTAQHCTPNSNAELNAVYQITGRYPAIRCGDLGKYSRNYSGADKDQNCEIELALDWAKGGGIVSFSWTWYEPLTDNDVSRYYSSQTTFKLNNAFTLRELAQLTPDHLAALLDANEISDECYQLILDIDDMAQNLKRLQNADVPVLWRPLMEAGVGWYWWGDCQPDSFIWLWRLMFDRMTIYHGLTNLIWIWNGENQNFYPGDDYVDIIGEDIYNMSDTSNLPRFNSTSRYTTKRKITAMTECGLIPDPDILKRDNAMWAWFGLFRGDYIVADNGLYFSEVNTKKRLNHAYNHELTVTLDELRIT